MDLARISSPNANSHRKINKKFLKYLLTNGCYIYSLYMNNKSWKVIMSLKEELKLKKGFDMLEHEALLNIYYTTTGLKKRADEFFKTHGLTDVQFNVLMLLVYQSGPEGGLSQVQLRDMMLVNRANITTLIDRMEKASLVLRTSTEDRRTNIIKLTAKGKKIFEKAEPLYAAMVKQAMAGFNQAQQKNLITTLEKVRTNISGKE
jgi:DNA-binding MarR family transcriptional regulator